MHGCIPDAEVECDPIKVHMYTVWCSITVKYYLEGIYVVVWMLILELGSFRQG